VFQAITKGLDTEKLTKLSEEDIQRQKDDAVKDEFSFDVDYNDEDD